MQALRRFLLPDGALIVAALVITRVPSARDAVEGIATGLLVAAIAAGVLLGVRFHRGRVVLFLLLLALADAALKGGILTPRDQAAAALAAVLLPLNVALIALLPERGTLTSAGLLRIGVLSLEILLVAPFTRWNPARTVALLDRHVLPAVLTGWIHVSQLALLAGVGALALFALIWFRGPSPIARGFFWAQGAVLFGLDAYGRGQDPTLWIAAAAFVLGIAVVESSYALAYHDGLTGLRARRAFTEDLRRLGDRYAVAMVDVDHFKACNDRWGHDVGDQVLRMVAAKLAKVGGRGGGTAYRYGGEEFAMLFPGKTATEVRERMEDLREAVEAAVFVVRHRIRPRRKPPEPRTARRRVQRVAVTVSAGVSDSDGARTPELVVQAADQALYRAKEGGRNRVVS